MKNKARETTPEVLQNDRHPNFGAAMIPLFLLTSIFFVNFLARIAVLEGIVKEVGNDLLKTGLFGLYEQFMGEILIDTDPLLFEGLN